MNEYVIYAGYFGVGLLGLLSHFLKRKIKGETLTDIKQWFSHHAKNTALSVIAFIISYAALIQTDDLSVLSSFMAGYMCDSIFSRSLKDGSHNDELAD